MGILSTIAKSVDELVTLITKGADELATKAKAAKAATGATALTSDEIVKASKTLVTDMSNDVDLDVIGPKIDNLLKNTTDNIDDLEALIPGIKKVKKAADDFIKLKDGKVIDPVDAANSANDASHKILVSKLRNVYQVGNKAIPENILTYYKSFDKIPATRFNEIGKYATDAVTQSSRYNMAVAYIKANPWLVTKFSIGAATLTLIMITTGKLNPVDAITQQLGKTAAELAKEAADIVIDTSKDIIDQTGIGDFFKKWGVYIAIAGGVMLMLVLFMMLK